MTPAVYGQDYGFSIDPTTLVKTSIDKAQKKIYVKLLLYRPKLTTSQIAAYNTDLVGKGLIYADSAEPRLIDELIKAGNNVKPAVKGQGSVTAGIAVLQDYQLIVDPESTELVKELNNYVWHDKKSGTPVDAYNHCFTGSTPVLTPNGYRPIKDIQKGDYVITPTGEREVVKKWNNGTKQVVKYLMQFDTFSLSLCCTKDHLIKTAEGWKAIEKITSTDTIYLSSFTEGLNLDYTPESVISHEAQGECTLLFGKRRTAGKCLKAFTSITKTKTPGITAPIIWSLRQATSISLSTASFRK